MTFRLPDAATIGKNALSGFLVFLVALPLCLAIAKASGFPPVAGVLTAIVGGILASGLGSADLTIKGPAAGLIVIVLGAVTELGGGDVEAGYRKALAVGVVAGLLQIGLAVTRAGALAAAMPGSVVHGMLAAIGVIIITKQTPVLLGVTVPSGEPLHQLLHLPWEIPHTHPLVFGVGALALIVLLVAPRIPVVRRVPAPMLALVLAVPASVALGLGTEGAVPWFGHEYPTGSVYLVNLPGNILDALVFPDFSDIFTAASLKYVVMFTLVGSIESLLSVLAVDALDPRHKVSNLHKDLFSVGVANAVVSAIGGLPMISEIVRSKANIDAGATGRLSNAFHGVFLLAFVALLPGLLGLIPLAVLAAMLVVTGFRLASPAGFRHAAHEGWDQLVIMVATTVLTLATDLLVGVGAGLVLQLVFHVVRAPTWRLFANPMVLARNGDTLNVKIVGPAAFTNALYVRAALSSVPDDVEQVRVSIPVGTLVDPTFLGALRGASAEWPRAKLVVDRLGADRRVGAGNHVA